MNETAKNLTPQKIFTQIFFSMKISRSTVSPKLQLIIYLKQVTVQQCMSRTREVALDILTQQMNSLHRSLHLVEAGYQAFVGQE